MLFTRIYYFPRNSILITELWVEWCKDRLKCQEKLVGLYDNLNQEIIHDMPLEMIPLRDDPRR